ncbi:MAG: histidine kinase [Desulforhopalus sp.]
MISEREQIERRISELEEEIAETKRRLPAHSVKPPVMMDLLELEDELDLLMKKLGAIECR